MSTDRSPGASARPADNAAIAELRREIGFMWKKIERLEAEIRKSKGEPEVTRRVPLTDTAPQRDGAGD